MTSKARMQKIICLIALLLMCLINMSCLSPSKLSPRIVKTKYGQLRGIIFQLDILANENFDQKNTLNDTNKNDVKKNLIEAFLGVSYAQPPIGSLRFLPPVSPAHWRGIKQADHFGSVCIQKLPKELQNEPNLSGSEFNIFQKNSNDTNKNEKSEDTNNDSIELLSIHYLTNFLRNQSEDCLHLNIYTPFHTKNRKEKIPILVFIHGPSYNWGSGNPYDGSILALYGEIIVITLNYRLGVFGFMPTESDGNVRGNYGLLDLIASLHWIQDNIAQFGGDQNNVTLIGHNRGAALVHLLMLSPMSKNLFHRAILMSGSALSPWAISSNSLHYSKKLTEKLSCSGISILNSQYNENSIMKEQKETVLNMDKSINCLRQKTAEEINNVFLETAEPLRSSFGPVVDGLLVPKEPSSLINSSQKANQQSNFFNHNFNFRAGSNHIHQSTNYDFFNHVNKPLLFGVTRVETPPFIFRKIEQHKGISNQRKGEMLRTLVSNLFNYYQEAISLTLINEYTDWSATGSEQNSIDSFIDILGDALVVAPLTNAVNLHLKLATRQKQNLKSSLNNVFSYVFVYQPEMSSLQSTRLGCVHGQELQFLFGAPISLHNYGIQLKPFKSNYSRQEVTLSKQLIAYWMNFVKFGNPNGKENEDNKSKINSNENEVMIWPNYDTLQRRYLMLGLKFKQRDHYHAHRLSLWLQLIPKLQSQGKFEFEKLKITLKEESKINIQNQLIFETTKDQSDHNKTLNSYWVDNFIEKLFNRIINIVHFNNNPSSLLNTFDYHFLMNSFQNYNYPLEQNASTKAHSSSAPYDLIKTNSIFFGSTEYSTTISLIIAVGLIILLLNIFVFLFAFIYKSKKKNKKINKVFGKKQVEENKKQNSEKLHKNSVESTNTSFLPINENLSTTTGPSAIYGPNSQNTFYYTNLTSSNDLSRLTNNSFIDQQNKQITNTLTRRKIDLSDYCCALNDQHLCIYSNNDNLSINENSIMNQVNSQANTLNTNNFSSNNLNITNLKNKKNLNDSHQHSTINCLSQNNHLSEISCQCDNCTAIALTSNSPLNNQLINNTEIVTNQATLLDASLVNLVNTSLCDSNQCNLTVIHEYEERL